MEDYINRTKKICTKELLIHDVNKHDWTTLRNARAKRVQDLYLHVFALILSEKLIISI